jgi:Ankyrin repeats (3 copies)
LLRAYFIRGHCPPYFSNLTTRRKLETSIIEAVKSNDIEQIKLIVDHGYKFTKQNSPLKLATSLGNLEIVRILVDAGCNIRWTSTNETK